ncbi:MAG: putative O-glycosylation ligase, exosortase A system-associated [Betaproteobacteria bacterium]|nr:putative O-glycosylation ligase, exosortase A system-associated [Betaproteobacteria bacterium]MBL8533440.1 putative O-glycosylation ligase, exosortase A system-associated [Betaproteobacteria bacterium]
MRDILVVILVGAIALSALRRPWIGIIGWTWVGLMNPHKQAWGFAASLPVAAIVGGATLAGFIATKDKRGGLLIPSSSMLIVFILWMVIVWPFSFYRDAAWPMLSQILKIQLMIFVAMALIYERKQIELLVLTIVASLGYYGIKGGLFTIMTGGGHRVWGPSGTFIEGNNELALALITVIPLMRYLQLQTKIVWKRHAWSGAMFLMAASAVGSHSRGALLAIGAMTGLLIVRSRNRFGLLVLAGVAAFFLVSFMPAEWMSRMNTIQTYEEDTSAMSRLDAWTMAFNVARNNVFGGGFEMWSPATYAEYYPMARLVVVAHSIYFQVLGELGFIGLFLYLTMWGLLWLDLGSVRRSVKGDPEKQWMADLAALCQVSLIGYLIGGTFLSLAYFDLPYNLIVICVCLRRLAIKAAPAEETIVIPKWFNRILQ